MAGAGGGKLEDAHLTIAIIVTSFHKQYLNLKHETICWLSVIIKETKRGCVRSVISFRLSHSTSKITDEELRRGRGCLYGTQMEEG